MNAPLDYTNGPTEYMGRSTPTDRAFRHTRCLAARGHLRHPNRLLQIFKAIGVVYGLALCLKFELERESGR